MDENFSALESRVASQAAELAFFREEFKKQEEERHLQSLVELHLTKLRDDGWCVTESTNAALQEIAQNSTDPESSVKAFCDSYRRSAVQDPPETFAEVTGHNVAEVPEFVQAYQKEGPEVYENAVAFSSQYDELKAAGADVRESREEFVANLIRGI